MDHWVVVEPGVLIEEEVKAEHYYYHYSSREETFRSSSQKQHSAVHFSENSPLWNVQLVRRLKLSLREILDGDWGGCPLLQVVVLLLLPLGLGREEVAERTFDGKFLE